jgi:hypothetical protein
VPITLPELFSSLALEQRLRHDRDQQRSRRQQVQRDLARRNSSLRQAGPFQSQPGQLVHEAGLEAKTACSQSSTAAGDQPASVIAIIIDPWLVENDLLWLRLFGNRLQRLAITTGCHSRQVSSRIPQSAPIANVAMQFRVHR